MADLAELAYGKFKGYPFNETKFLDFLKSEGYGNIKIAETDIPDVLKNTSVSKMKRYIVGKEGETKTLFVALDTENTHDYFYLRDGIVYSLNDKNANISVTSNPASEGFALGIMLLFVGSMLALMIYGAVGLVSAIMDANDDDDYEYIYDDSDYNYSDDKDADGDVDYDDVEKYLEDSLEEDKNDGDDW